MSLGMDFARRRMMTAADSGPKFVWAVYECGYDKDESTVVSGSFSANRTITKMVSSSYTASASGFSLDSASSTAVRNINAGQYIVDVSTSNNSSTSGVYLYQVTARSGSTTISIAYNRYEATMQKGTEELYRVESDTLDYPYDGEQDGYWYTMIKGELEFHVWDVYNATVGYSEKSETRYRISGIASNAVIYLARSSYGGSVYSFDSSTGIFTLNDSYITQHTGVSAFISATGSSGSDARYMIGAKSGTEMYRGYSGYSSSSISGTTRYYSDFSATKGNATGDTVESPDVNTYPQDSYQGSKWYTYSHSYINRFDNR